MPTQASTSTSAPELAILPALDVAMLGLTANIGKLVTFMVSVSVSGVGVLVLVLWTTICCIHQKVTISIMLLITVYRDAGVLDNSGKSNRMVFCHCEPQSR